VGLICVLCALGWWVWTGGADDERPAVYDVLGTQPGDLSPDLVFEDNLNHYGIDVDLSYEVHTNRLGFRGHNPPKDSSPVVVVVGDSFVFGMGVDTSQTFPAQLEARLREQWPKAVVHNAGVPGYSILDQQEHWRAKLHTLRPDVVLLCHTASDLKEMSRPTSFRRIVAFDDESPDADPTLATLIAENDGDKRALMESEYVLTQGELLKKLGRTKAHQVLSEHLSSYIDHLVTYAKEVKSSENNPVFGVVFWVDGYGMLGLNASPVRRALRERGILFFDGDGALRGQKAISPEALFLPDNHFTAQGNALAADHVHDWLRKQSRFESRLSR